jgi:hypothetical protein
MSSSKYVQFCACLASSLVIISMEFYMKDQTDTSRTTPRPLPLIVIPSPVREPNKTLCPKGRPKPVIDDILCMVFIIVQKQRDTSLEWVYQFYSWIGRMIFGWLSCTNLWMLLVPENNNKTVFFCNIFRSSPIHLQARSSEVSYYNWNDSLIDYILFYIFSSFGDIAIDYDLDVCLTLGVFEQGKIFKCHRCCGTGLRFMSCIPRTAPFSRSTYVRQARECWGHTITRMITGLYDNNFFKNKINKGQCTEEIWYTGMSAPLEIHKTNMIFFMKVFFIIYPSMFRVLIQ